MGGGGGGGVGGGGGWGGGGGGDVWRPVSDSFAIIPSCRLYLREQHDYDVDACTVHNGIGSRNRDHNSSSSTINRARVTQDVGIIETCAHFDWRRIFPLIDPSFGT